MKEVKGLYRFDGCKLLWFMDRVEAHFKYGKRIYPLHIDIGATKICNAKCIYCYGIHQKMSNDIIPRIPLINLFADAPTIGIKSITVTGDGEPTLNPHIYEALGIGWANGLDIGFATNGIELNEDKIEQILHTCTWLRFNLSAIGHAGYKSLHGVQQWERVQANIKLAIKIKKESGYKCTIGLQMVLVPQALNYVVPQAKWASAIGVDYFVIKQFSDPGCKEMSQFNLNWYDNPDTIQKLKVAEAQSTDKTKIIAKWGMIKLKGKRPYDKCLDVPLLFQISGSSKCYPCGFLFGNDKYCYGDLKDNSLKEILDSERYWEVIEYMQTKFNVHKDCTGCCRHDFTNKFIHDYMNPPEHLNFI